MAKTCSCFKGGKFQRKCSWIVSEEKEFGIMNNDCCKQCCVWKKKVKLVFGIRWSDIKRQIEGIIFATPGLSWIFSEHIFGQIYSSSRVKSQQSPFEKIQRIQRFCVDAVFNCFLQIKKMSVCSFWVQRAMLIAGMGIPWVFLLFSTVMTSFFPSFDTCQSSENQRSRERQLTRPTERQVLLLL